MNAIKFQVFRLPILKQSGGGDVYSQWPCHYFSEFSSEIIDELGDRAMIFDGGSRALEFCLNELKSRNEKYHVLAVPLANKKNHSDFPYYYLTLKDFFMMPKRSIPPIAYYENQFNCSFPFLWDGENPYPWGCSRQPKKQIRNYVFTKKNKLVNRDIFELDDGPLLERQTNFVISDRLKDALIEGGFIGFKILPIFQYGTNEYWKFREKIERELVLEANTEHYQLTITEKCHPIPTASEGAIKKCDYCELYKSDFYPSIRSRNLPLTVFKNADLQYCSEGLLPDGFVIKFWSGKSFVSQRLLKMVEDRKFTGFSKPMNLTKWYEAVPLEIDLLAHGLA